MPEEIPAILAARTLLYDSLAQNDVDMNFHRLLNLDTSNLGELGSPPTIHPPVNKWLHDWDNPGHAWTATQPFFTHIGGILTTGIGGQQRAITELGTISIGTWQATLINQNYLPTLDLIRVPTGNVNLNNRRIVAMADPVNAQDAVTKHFMDFLLQGLQVKEAVRVASLSTVNPVGNPVIDGIQTRDGDRVLLTNQGSHIWENGIYIVIDDGTNRWARSTDADSRDDLLRAYCTVREGTQAGTGWVQVSNAITDPVNPDDVITFLLFSTATGEPGPPGEDGHGVPEGGSLHQILRKKSGGDFDTEWADPGIVGIPDYAKLQTIAAINPTGTTSQTAVMMGMAHDNRTNPTRITPITSGKVVVTVTGSIHNDNPAGGGKIKMYLGFTNLVSAPDNGAPPPVSGAVPIGSEEIRGAMAAFAPVPFSTSAIFTGITPGAEMWIDLALTSLGTIGSRVAVLNVSVTAYEIP